MRRYESDILGEEWDAGVFTNRVLNEEVEQMIQNDLQPLTNSFENHAIEMRCYPHTLQLAVLGAIKAANSSTTSLLNVCRIMAKQLRLKSVITVLKMQSLYVKKPRRECLTRWSSLYLLVCIFTILHLN